MDFYSSVITDYLSGISALGSTSPDLSASAPRPSSSRSSEEILHLSMDRFATAADQEKALPGLRHEPFNPIFPSLQNVSQESERHPNFLENHPYPLGRDVPSDEALRKIRTANSITISPGKALGTTIHCRMPYWLIAVSRIIREDLPKSTECRQGRTSVNFWQSHPAGTSRLSA